MSKFRDDHYQVMQAMLRTYPQVREGRMFGHPAFYVGKKMFACLYGDGVGLKLPAHEVTRLLKEAHALPFQPYGKPKMREWVQLNRADSSDYHQDLAVLELAMDFVTETSGL